MFVRFSSHSYISANRYLTIQALNYEVIIICTHLYIFPPASNSFIAMCGNVRIKPMHQ